MQPFHLPSDVARRIRSVHGQSGTDWLADLPALADYLMNRWDLVRAGLPFPGARAGWIAPVWTGTGTGLVLKIVPDPAWAATEAATLASWGGHGAVELIGADVQRGALLLERVMPGNALIAECSTDDRHATALAAAVISGLRSATVRPDVTLPDLSSWTAVLRGQAMLTGPETLRREAARAQSIADDLLAGAPRMLLHGDLQHYNILQAERVPWLAIDPKGLLGPPAAEASALLRNPRRFVLSHDRPVRLLADRLAVLSEHLGDDPRQLASWGYVLAVVAAAWGVEDRDDAEDVERWLACAALLRRVVA